MRVEKDREVKEYTLAVNNAQFKVDSRPSSADVFVDGQYVGPVGNFGSDTEPLTLAIGQHRIAIQREGYRPLEWDVTIEAGMVIPYRGTLERQ